ncbi:integrase [Gossypium australe]|uniref:Integrase n=1 Tax=Gossypium australe TaxID=47621 RepID=A0A5B6WZP8_9ROSI|nr:integrase [Gossypium australe]
MVRRPILALVRMMYWWPRMKREISKFVSKCLVKDKHQVLSKVLQPIMISKSKHMKSAHFIPARSNYSLDKLAELLHGVPLSTVFYQDLRFTFGFQGKLHEALGTKLNFSIAFHPQINKQSK